jgi:hypothetical protein
MATLLLDSQLRERFAKAGRARVLRDFDLQNNTGRILSLFHATMGLSTLQPSATPEPATSQARSLS